MDTIKEKPDEKMTAAMNMFGPLVGVLFRELSRRLAALPDEEKTEVFQTCAMACSAKNKEDFEEISQTLYEMIFPETLGGIVGSPDAPSSSALEKRSLFIGGRIRAAREKRQMTQEDLAEKADLPQSHISRLEAGKHSPSHKTLTKIATALGVLLTELDYSVEG